MFAGRDDSNECVVSLLDARAPLEELHIDEDDGEMEDRVDSTPVDFTAAVLRETRGPSCQRRREVRQDLLNTDLLDSVEVQDIKLTERYLERGANASSRCRMRNVSACHVAAFLGGRSALESLIAAGAKPWESGDVLGRTALHCAAWAGHAACVELLISGNGREKIDLERGKQLLPLEEELDAVGHACGYFTDLVKSVWSERTALQLAAARLQPECVRLLLNAGAKHEGALDLCGAAYLEDVSECDPQRFAETIEVFAAHARSSGIKPVSDKQTDEESSCGSALHLAVRLESPAGIRALLRLGARPTCRDCEGYAPLHLAVLKRSRPALEALCDTQEDVIDVRDTTGRTPLMLASYEDWGAGALALLAAGADTTTTTPEGDTALHFAAAAGNIAIVTELLRDARRKRLDFASFANRPGSKGASPLLRAVENDRTACVRTLLAEGAAAAPAKNATSALHAAAALGYADILRELIIIDRELDLSERTSARLDPSTGLTPLHAAALEDRAECVKILVKAGADVTAALKNGDTPLHLAAESGRAATTIALLELSPEAAKIRNTAGRTPFQSAACAGRKETVRAFVDAGADLAERINMKGTAAKVILKTVPRSVAFVSDLFDSRITVNNYSLDEEECRITLDYSLLTPVDRDQMEVVAALFAPGGERQRKTLLLHPLIESFLYLKWQSTWYFFVPLLLLNVLFVSSVSLYIMSIYSIQPDILSEYQIYPKVAMSMTAVCIFIMEITLLRGMGFRELPGKRVWLQLLALLMAVAVLSVPHSSETMRYVSASALLVAWMHLVMLISCMPDYGYYFQMFAAVSARAVKVLILFGGLMAVGFALCLWVLFGAAEPFDTPWNAIMKTFVMMTSEFDYSDMFSKEEWEVSRVIVQLIFVMFLLFVPVVLMNLLLALAVSDTKELEVEGKVQRLQEQVEFLGMLEGTLVRSNWISRKLMAWFGCRAVPGRLELRPALPTGHQAGEHRLPHDLMEAICSHVEKRIDPETQLAQLAAQLARIERILETAQLSYGPRLPSECWEPDSHR